MPAIMTVTWRGVPGSIQAESEATELRVERRHRWKNIRLGSVRALEQMAKVNYDGTDSRDRGVWADGGWGGG